MYMCTLDDSALGKKNLLHSCLAFVKVYKWRKFVASPFPRAVQLWKKSWSREDAIIVRVGASCITDLHAPSVFYTILNQTFRIQTRSVQIKAVQFLMHAMLKQVCHLVVFLDRLVFNYFSAISKSPPHVVGHSTLDNIYFLVESKGAISNIIDN